jgi:hypothetical protein
MHTQYRSSTLNPSGRTLRRPSYSKRNSAQKTRPDGRRRDENRQRGQCGGDALQRSTNAAIIIGGHGAAK